MEAWLTRWESVWLFWILAAELIISSYTAWILTMEYFYDAKLEEEKQKKRKTTKKKVKVVIDKEGNARISEAPKGIDISVEHEGRE